jgi:hypothetical protein
MDEIFIKKVRTAAAAGWWTFLIGYCLVLISWFGFLLTMARQPEGMLCLFGKDATWEEIHTVWLWGLVAYKLCVGMILFVAVWLTLWARQLAKNRTGM